MSRRVAVEQLARLRAASQRLGRPADIRDPVDVVRLAGPVQAQEPRAARLAFRARARGLTGGEFSLLAPDDEEFGRLRMRPPFGACFEAGASETEITREGDMGSRYRMTTDGAVVLIAGPEGHDGGFRILCGGRTYEAHYKLLRNTATAHLVDAGDAAVRLEGGLAGRSYGATFPENDGAALAVAVFLLYRNAALRRETF